MYKHDTVVPDIKSDLEKKEQVAQMFDAIAPRYDFFNRFLSFGIDIGWRKKAIKYVADINPKYILDVATGTADLAIMMHKKLSINKIDGIDISAEMLKVGQEKVLKANAANVINLQLGDSEAINFSKNTFDAVTVAFGVRNFEDLEKGLSEINRVLKENGRLVILEFSKPRKKIWKWFYSFYNGKIAPKMVGSLSKNKKAYEYLNASINAFPERADFISVLNKLGFKNSFYKELSFGICCIYVADK